MPEYILKLVKHEAAKAPYFHDLGGSFFMHLNVAHPRQAKKFDNLYELLFYINTLPEKIKSKFVARPYYKELQEYQAERRQRKTKSHERTRG